MIPEVEYRVEGRKAILTLSRDEKLNAISTPMSRYLQEVLSDIDEDRRTRVIVLEARGRFFCAGADIREYANSSQRDFDAYQQRNRRLYEMLERNSKPVVCAVNGPALGGGFELVLVCDLVIAGKSVYFSLPEIGLGLLPGGGGTQRLTRLVGKALAKEFVMTGRKITSDDALRLGIVNYVVPDHEVATSAYSLADELADYPSRSLEMAKRLINNGADSSMAAGLDYERSVLSELFSSADGREGVSAFLEKRAPNFPSSKGE